MTVSPYFCKRFFISLRFSGLSSQITIFICFLSYLKFGGYARGGGVKTGINLIFSRKCGQRNVLRAGGQSDRNGGSGKRASGFFPAPPSVSVALRRIHIGIFDKTDGKLRKRTVTAGTDGFMAVQNMDSVTVFTVMQIHHGKALLSLFCHLFRRKSMGGPQVLHDKKRAETGKFVEYVWELVERFDFS